MRAKVKTSLWNPLAFVHSGVPVLSEGSSRAVRMSRSSSYRMPRQRWARSSPVAKHNIGKMRPYFFIYRLPQGYAFSMNRQAALWFPNDAEPERRASEFADRTFNVQRSTFNS